MSTTFGFISFSDKKVKYLCEYVWCGSRGDTGDDPPDVLVHLQPLQLSTVATHWTLPCLTLTVDLEIGLQVETLMRGGGGGGGGGRGGGGKGRKRELEGYRFLNFPSPLPHLDVFALCSSSRERDFLEGDGTLEGHLHSCLLYTILTTTVGKPSLNWERGGSVREERLI